MFACGVSGQQLYFGLVSVLSGFPVTGMSGAISGRKAIDGGALALLSGNIVEDAGGLYHANLFALDTSGKHIGFLFTCSGSIPVPMHVITDLNQSGRVNLASGNSVRVYSGQLSGQVIDLLSGRSYTASGIHAVATATVSSGQVWLASGHAVFVYSGQLSGQPVNPLSGTTLLGSGNQGEIHRGAAAAGAVNTITLDGAANGNDDFYNDQLIELVAGTGTGQARIIDDYNGLTKVATVRGNWVTQPGVTSQFVIWPAGQITATVQSGDVFLASGQPVALLSGQSILVYSGQLSGHAVDLLSGRSYTASGIFATATATINSGEVWLASGHATALLSGQSVLVYSGRLSGQQVTARTVSDKSGYTIGANLDKSGYTAGLISGVNFFASGQHVVVPPATLSGVNATVPIATVSGINVVVPPAALSGLVVNSGLFVHVPIATISGVQAVATATVQSGEVYLASGQAAVFSGLFYPASGQQVVAAVVSDKSGYTVGSVLDKSGYTVGSVLDKSGYTLTASGLDTITIETGLNFRQAQSLVAAAAVGQLSGAGTTTIRIAGANVAGTNRLTATVDQRGNRTAITLSLPT